MEKQKQLAYKDRRTHPRMKCRVTIEMQTDAGGVPLFANLTDISMGGCYRNQHHFAAGSKLKVGIFDG